MRKGQGTFEYVLLLGGVLLIVVLAIVVLQNTASAGFQGTASKQCNARLVSEIACASTSAPNGYNECGIIDNASYKDCGALTMPASANCPALPTPNGNQGFKYCGARPLS